MKEYGGYIELDRYRLPMLHEGAVALNCGRNALAYLIKARNIKKIKVPYFLCDSILEVCRKYSAEMSFYHINENFMPENLSLSDGEWLYLINYYGQLDSQYIKELKNKYGRVIVDNAQAYFEMPIPEIDTLYTCRKFFGVADGAFLYTDKLLEEELPKDESFDRMRFLLGRFERTASEFYSENMANNRLFSSEPIKKMSKLTDNLLHAIDYEFVKKRRTGNFASYHTQLGKINQLKLRKIEGAFAYPLLVENGAEIRKKLQQQRIYIPTLWPNVLREIDNNSLEYKFAENILPLPVDQRYSEDDINELSSRIKQTIKGGNHE